MNAAIQWMAFDDSIAQLLQANSLPTDDLPGNPDVELFGCCQHGVLAGVVGLELHGKAALLRSLAVDSSRQGQGLGIALLRHAESVAAAKGVQNLYLLTTTAERYFQQRGYGSAGRDTAPSEIQGTRQFAGLCPASSAFMVKRLA
jgi:amino-acid N-acetyltransferase